MKNEIESRRKIGENVGDRIRHFRELGMCQNSLAEHLGLSRRSLYYIETGKTRNVKNRIKEKLSSFEAIFQSSFPAEQKSSSSIEITAWCNLFAMLSQESQRRIVQIMYDMVTRQQLSRKFIEYLDTH